MFASVMAFFFSELADLIVYTPMRKRWPAWAVMVSGLIGSIVDSAIFPFFGFWFRSVYCRPGSRKVLDVLDCRCFDWLYAPQACRFIKGFELVK